MIGITQDLLKELFDYRDSNLYWRVVRGTSKIGDRAGWIGNKYYQIGINGKKYYAHRLIFLYHHGYLPEFIDHIDGNRLNNSISNLRKATNQENQWNREKTKSINCKPPSSDFKGVSWNKHAKKWRVQIRIDSKTKHIGYFTSEIEAARAHDNAAIESRGKFVRQNYDEIKMVDEV